tara:strand:- start:344 stop:784 length:441 start_codon:yes stop_codon:yes gene_type:complete
MINSIFDLISLLIPSIIYLISFAQFLKNNYTLINGILVTYILEKLFKYLTKNIDIFKRPLGAYNCDIFNCNGNVENNPGFPSGHVAVTSFFMNYLFFKSRLCISFYIFYCFPIYIVAISRIYKKCHNIEQVIGGYLLGLAISKHLT